MDQPAIESASRTRVLIIDDEAGFRESVAEYLREHGFEVHTAVDGDVGLKLFQKLRPDLVLVDLRMENLDGLEVMAEVLRQSPETPCVVVSGAGKLQDAIDALRIGASDYLTKPLPNLQALVLVVRRSLERVRLLRENRQYREELERQVDLRTAELQARAAELERLNTRLVDEISERKRIECLIAKAKKEWETTFDSVSDQIGIVGPDFRFLRVNRTLADAHGLHPRDLVGKLSFPFFGCLDAQTASCPHKIFIEGSARTNGEEIIHCVELDQWDYLSTTPLYSNGDYLGTLVVFRDVTERIRAQEALRVSESRFRLLAENAKDIVSRLTLGGEFRYVSPSCGQILGFSPEELLGTSIYQYIHPEDLAEASACLRMTSGRFLGRMRTRGGDWVFMETSCHHVLASKTGQVLEVHASSRDVTEAVRTREALQRSNEKFSKAFHTSLDGFAIAKYTNGVLLEVNRGFAQILGLDPQALIDVSLDALPWWLAPDEQHRLRGELDLHQEVRDFRASLQTRHGEAIFIQLSASRLELQQEPCVIYSIRDITHQKVAEDEVKYMALHDQLTGLPNRRLFLDRFEQALYRAKRYGETLGLLFVDLDSFKEINDRQGHLVGDAVLKEAASRLERCVRRTDSVARIGGDEFVVLLGGRVKAATMELVAKKIIQELSRQFELLGYHGGVGASIGISLFPEDGQTLDALLSKADAAMYRAKQAGGGIHLHHAPD